MKSQTNTGYVAFLSLVAAIGGILFGYDTAVISGTISGVASQFSLDAMQQGWFVGCALVGSIGGVAVAGVLSDRFGRKQVLVVTFCMMGLCTTLIGLIPSYASIGIWAPILLLLLLGIMDYVFGIDHST